MRYAIIQNNPKVGDIRGNAEKLLAGVREAARQGVELCLSTELALEGYPPCDLLFYPAFVEESERSAQALIQATAELDTALVLGCVGRSGSTGKPLVNQALFISGGKVLARYAKRLLPTYDVFDETRYFEPGVGPCVVPYRGRRFCLTICEDIWNDDASFLPSDYAIHPLVDSPAFDVLLNLSASPFTLGKQAVRREMLARLSAKYGAPVLYANQVGGNDELIFDGRSLQLGPDGAVLAEAKGFEEDLLLGDLDFAESRPPDDPSPERETWQALTLGIRDYCGKSGLKKVVLGLSGGIDSSLTAALACEALGPDKVIGALMPSSISSRHSVTDAKELAANLNMRAVSLPIAEIVRSYEQALAPIFTGLPPDTTEENLQARARGMLVMALTNKLGAAMALSTGNKSELSVGYCTLYGDMCGGLAVIGDLYKTEVFRLCRWLNEARGPVIPENVLTKPPSAELRPEQTDQDSLPPYDILDAILHGLLEERLSVRDLIAAGHEPQIVRQVAGLVKNSEFKRKQAAPVLKITRLAFGVGRRIPVVCEQPYLNSSIF